MSLNHLTDNDEATWAMQNLKPRVEQVVFPEFRGLVHHILSDPKRPRRSDNVYASPDNNSVSLYLPLGSIANLTTDPLHCTDKNTQNYITLTWIHSCRPQLDLYDFEIAGVSLRGTYTSQLPALRTDINTLSPEVEELLFVNRRTPSGAEWWGYPGCDSHYDQIPLLQVSTHLVRDTATDAVHSESSFSNEHYSLRFHDAYGRDYRGLLWPVGVLGLPNSQEQPLTPQDRMRMRWASLIEIQKVVRELALACCLKPDQLSVSRGELETLVRDKAGQTP